MIHETRFSSQEGRNPETTTSADKKKKKKTQEKLSVSSQMTRKKTENFLTITAPLQPNTTEKNGGPMTIYCIKERMDNLHFHSQGDKMRCLLTSLVRN